MAEWSRIMGVELSPWEAKTLRRLSRAYVNQRAEARSPACIEPLCKGDQETARSRVETQFASLFAALQRRTST
ncbi:MAG: hypothetical protein DI555_14140 [Novosphingobium pentaromativorans]|uniref:Uncharacterized protein n=1 Tax=Novosphingobium pentaromativorans TaxID=205844 RepID=A0A2W5NU56_9SPHN|nr:MAG: hypothetical protein DI555_14140 [Novosphingobium pentaromativorans]